MCENTASCFRRGARGLLLPRFSIVRPEAGLHCILSSQPTIPLRCMVGYIPASRRWAGLLPKSIILSEPKGSFRCIVDSIVFNPWSPAFCAGRLRVAHHERSGMVGQQSSRFGVRLPAGRLTIPTPTSHRAGSMMPCFSSNSLHSLAKSIFR